MFGRPVLGLVLLLCLFTSAFAAGSPDLPADVSRLLHIRGKSVSDFALISAPGSAPHLLFLPRRGNLSAWLRLVEPARSAADSFTSWYGACARESIIVVDAAGLVAQDSVASGTVFLCRAPVPLLRIQERELCRLLARQWFPSVAGDSDAWLSFGLSEHAACRFLEGTYGTDNLLDLPCPAGPLSGLGEAYLKRVLYVLGVSNNLLEPLGSVEESRLVPLPVLEARRAQVSLFVEMLRRQVGKDSFDRGCRLYRESGGAFHSSVSEFIRSLSLATRRNVSWMFERWLGNEGQCDYAVLGLRNRRDTAEIAIRQLGSIPMPLELVLRFRDGTERRAFWAPESGARPGAENPRSEVFLVGIPISSPVVSVVADPDLKLVESNRWNNYWPRRVEVRPFFALPSLDAYQLFYGPYVWYDSYRGIRLGAWVQGREFVSAGPLRGRHMWTLSEIYSAKIGDWHTSASYITPLDFISNRLRVSFLGDYSLVAAGVRLSILQELGRVFGRPSGLVDFGYRYFDLYDTTGRDSRAWEPARTAEVRVRVLHYWQSGVASGGQYLYVGRGITGLGGNYNYWKASLEENFCFRLAGSLRFGLRLFCGAITGAIPAQEQFYLSGGLVPNSSEPLSWGWRGKASAQEHWHHDADANCRGFAGRYVHGRYAYGANVHLEPLSFLVPFFDLGDVMDTERDFRYPKMDAGVRLKLGPLYADFPFWRWSEENGHELAFRWMLGLKLVSGV